MASPDARVCLHCDTLTTEINTCDACGAYYCPKHAGACYQGRDLCIDHNRIKQLEDDYVGRPNTKAPPDD